MSSDFDAASRLFQNAEKAAHADYSDVNAILHELADLSARRFVADPPGRPVFQQPGPVLPSSAGMSARETTQALGGAPPGVSGKGGGGNASVAEAWKSWTNDAWKRLQQGQKILDSEVQETVEWCVQQAADLGQVRSKRDIKRIIKEFFDRKTPAAPPVSPGLDLAAASAGPVVGPGRTVDIDALLGNRPRPAPKAAPEPPVMAEAVAPRTWQDRLEERLWNVAGGRGRWARQARGGA